MQRTMKKPSFSALNRLCTVLLPVAFCFLAPARGEIHVLELENDARTALSVETFAFDDGGHVDLVVRNYSLYIDEKFSTDVTWGLLLRPVTTKSDGPAILAMEAQGISSDCSIDKALRDDSAKQFVVPLGGHSAGALARQRRRLHWGRGDLHEHEINRAYYTHNFTTADMGRYDIEVIVCLPKDKSTANVEVTAHIREMCYNVRGSGAITFLSAGEVYNAEMYGFFAFLFLGAVCAWIYVMLQRQSNIRPIHYVMLVLILFKTTSLVAYTAHLVWVAQLGSTLNVLGWDIIYFLFSFLDGGVMFVLILLVGSGWSYLKPTLNDRENKMLGVVIVLQVLANVARIFVGESSPGSLGFVRWSDLLAVVDVTCCALVLFPIIWSLNKLKNELAEVQAAKRAEQESGTSNDQDNQSDEEGQFDRDPGELARAVTRYQQFRRFYIIVVAYIYFTRIVVYLVDSSLPFQLAFLAPFVQEIATLAFYVTTAYHFLPAADNPYLQLSTGMEGIASHDSEEHQDVKDIEVDF